MFLPPPLPPPSEPVPDYLLEQEKEEKAKKEAEEVEKKAKEEETSESAGKKARKADEAETQAGEAPAASREALSEKAGGSEEKREQYLIVAHELATKSLKGKKGILHEDKGDEVAFYPMSYEKCQAPLMCPKSWIVYIDHLEAQTARHQEKKQCTWIDKALSAAILQEMTFQPQEPVPDLTYALFAENVDAGIAEILYRLTPGIGFASLPSSLSKFINDFDKATTLDERAKPEKGNETHKLKVEMYDRVEKARVIIIPVQAAGHWTLLVLERVEEQKANDSTTATNPLGATDTARRKMAEKRQFAVSDWPIYPMHGEQVWEVRYYDTLPFPCSSCLRVAEKSLEILFSAGFGIFPKLLLPVKNQLRQSDVTTCGLWILHYIEEEARAYLGEKRGTLHADLDYRLERVNQMQDALLTRIVQHEMAEAEGGK